MNNCKACKHCRPSYIGGWCVRRKKKVKYSDKCEEHQEKHGQD